MRTVITSLLLSFSLFACAADATEESDGATGSTSEAVMNNGGGPRNDFSCSDGFCTCTGDIDCNDMFSGTSCTDGPAICQINGEGIPRCRCTAASGGNGHALKRPPISRMPVAVSPVISVSRP